MLEAMVNPENVSRALRCGRALACVGRSWAWRPGSRREHVRCGRAIVVGDENSACVDFALWRRRRSGIPHYFH